MIAIISFLIILCVATIYVSIYLYKVSVRLKNMRYIYKRILTNNNK